MREILFRGQTRRYGQKVNMAGEKQPGKWVYGGIFPGTGDYSVIYGAEAEEFTGADIDKYTVYSDTVGQYTGLKDKNGKRIFEGDIIQTERDLFGGENKKEREIFNSVAFYDTKSACFGLKSNKYRCLPLRRFKGDFNEIIGNVHDNPELLKGGEADGN